MGIRGKGGNDNALSMGSTATHEHANYGADTCCSPLASGRDRWEQTSPVGAFPPNAFGLYDLHGNVLQFVQDYLSPSYAGLPTDDSAYETVVDLKMTGRLSSVTGTSSCSYQIVRGGDWAEPPAMIQSAYRNFGPGPVARLQDYRSAGLGFRVARTLE